MVDYARQEDEAALKHFKKVVKIEPDHPDAILSVGSLGRISEQGL